MARLVQQSGLSALVILVVLLTKVSADTQNVSDEIEMVNNFLHPEHDRLVCGTPENRHIGTFSLYDYR